MQQLIPNPSEGKIRALFGTGKNAILAKTAEIKQQMRTRQSSQMTHYNANPFGPTVSRQEASTGNARKLRTAGYAGGPLDGHDDLSFTKKSNSMLPPGINFKT